MVLSREYALLFLAFFMLLSFVASGSPTAAPTLIPGICDSYNPGGYNYLPNTNTSQNCYNCANEGCSWCDPNNGGSEFCFDPNTNSCNGFASSGSATFVCDTDGRWVLALIIIILLAIFLPIVICGCLACVGGSVLYGSVWAIFCCFCRRTDNNAQPGFIGGNPQGHVSLYHISTFKIYKHHMTNVLFQPYVGQSPMTMIPAGQVQYVVSAPGQQIPGQVMYANTHTTGKPIYATAQTPVAIQINQSV